MVAEVVEVRLPLIYNLCSSGTTLSMAHGYSKTKRDLF